MKLYLIWGDFVTIYDERIVLTKKSKSNQEETRIQKANRFFSKTQKSYFMGFGFDYFNCRNLGLQDMDTSRFCGNLYISEGPEEYFRQRRRETSRIRTMLPNIEFKYGKCSEFINLLFTSPRN